MFIFSLSREVAVLETALDLAVLLTHPIVFFRLHEASQTGVYNFVHATASLASSEGSSVAGMAKQASRYICIFGAETVPEVAVPGGVLAMEVVTVIKVGLVSVDPDGVDFLVHEHFHADVIGVLVRIGRSLDHGVVLVLLASTTIGDEGNSFRSGGPARNVDHLQTRQVTLGRHSGNAIFESDQ